MIYDITTDFYRQRDSMTELSLISLYYISSHDCLKCEVITVCENYFIYYHYASYKDQVILTDCELVAVDWNNTCTMHENLIKLFYTKQVYKR